MKFLLILVPLLLVAAVTHAGKHHRKHRKNDEIQHTQVIGGSGEHWPGVSGSQGGSGGLGGPEGSHGFGGAVVNGGFGGPGSDFPGIPGSPGDSSDQDYPGSISTPSSPFGGDNTEPTGAVRKVLSHHLRASLAAARRDSKLRVR